MVNFNFNLKEKNKKTETLVKLIIRYNKNKLTYSTQEKINPKFWQDDPTKRKYQRAIETKAFPEFPEFNLRLDRIEALAKTIFRQYLNDHDNRLPTTQELKRQLDIKLRKVEENATQERKETFFEFAEKFIEESKSKVNKKTGKKFSPYTILGYKNCLKTIRDFSYRYEVPTDFETIDMDWYHKYVEYLAKDVLLATNSIGNKIKIVKTILNDAGERGLHNNQIFRSRKFCKTTENRDEIYITDEELVAFENLDLSHSRKLDHVRDAFLISCYSGLRYSDLVSLTKDNLQDGFIRFRSKKTGQLVVVPIHPVVNRIIEKYKDVSTTSLPKFYSNVKMNEYIKDIGEMIPAFDVEVTRGFTKGGAYVEETKKKYELIKTHTARRSFSTNAYKQGIPSRVIMSATGHRTETSFMKYLKTTSDEDAALLKGYFDKEDKT